MHKTAESVTPKHPDKLCDRVSDAILDECLRQDPMSRVAIETMGGHGIITITGELTTKAYVDMQKIARSIVGDQYGITINVVQQSSEIANGVDTGGAGDQGIMSGYACNDNEDFIPQELYLARSLCKFLYNLHPFDGKTEVTINEDYVVTAVVASFQNVPKEELEFHISEWFKINLFPRIDKLIIIANGAGDWKTGGFEADTGLTGRKLVVDNYGPQVPIGGGCYSGKDATKVDRSGAYMCRRIAVDLLKHHEAKEVTVKVAYSIGVADPIMATAVIDGREVDLLDEPVRNYISRLQPLAIIDFLELRKPQFEKTAQWGHYGNGFMWDKELG